MVTRALDVVGEAVNNGKSYRVYVRGSKWYISERSGNVLRRFRINASSADKLLQLGNNKFAATCEHILQAVEARNDKAFTKVKLNGG